MTRPETLTPLDLVARIEALRSAGQTAGSDLAALLLDLGGQMRELHGDPQSRAALLDALVGSIRAERGFLVQGTEIDSNLEWTVLASRSFEHEDILNPSDKIIARLLDPCRERSVGFFTANLEEEPVFGSLRRERQPRTRSVLIAPFPDPNVALYLDHRFQSLTLSDATIPTFAWLFTLLVSAEATTEWERIHGDLVADLQAARQNARSPAAPRPSESVAVVTPADSRGVAGEFSDIVGRHPDVLEILELIAKIAPTMAPILINGESGTGKELVASAVHKNSHRSKAPFVTENCAALAENLLEAELFGTMRGAYTGAHQDRPGLFEQAHGGTLFLDEIGDTSPGLQKKLLRVLQEGTIRRLGGQELIHVDVRIISATNKDLLSEVQAGRFREDLFYRLNVINLVLPPLRERREDIPLLAQHFVDLLNKEEGLEKQLTNTLVSTLMVHDWPGNIRELQNEIRRIYALGGQYLKVEDLSPRIVAGHSSGAPSFSLDFVLEHGSLKSAGEAWEKMILQASLKRFGGNKAQVGARLEIPKTTLYAKLKRYGLLEA